MWLEIVQDTKFFDLLLAIDADLAAEVRGRGCQECGGPLHQANYPRKPRGGIDLEDAKRWSLCCGREGCRKRHLPSSVVYLGRRVYYGVVLVLVMVMREGLTAKRVAKLRKELGVSRQTLARWRSWWRDIFPESAFWRAARSRLLPPVDEGALPGSLLERWSGELRERVVSMMKFLGPVTRGREHEAHTRSLRA